MIFQSIKYKVFGLFAGVAMMFSGCHHSDDPCPPEGPDITPEMLTLCLNVSMEGEDFGTRAEVPDGYVDPADDKFEKISTLRVIIVRNLTEVKDETTGTITSITGIVEANRLVMTNDMGRPVHDDLEFKVIANEDKRIYLIANEASLTPPADFVVPSPATPTVMRFLESFKVDKKPVSLLKLSNWTVSLPNITSTTKETTKGLFSPTKEVSDPRLPLTEFFDIYVKRDKNIDLTCYSHLFMTRTAAKAKFFLTASENFVNDGAVNPIIESISLSGVGTMEYVFPRSAVYSPGKESLIGDSPYYTGDIKTYIKDFSTPEDNQTVTFRIKEINQPVLKPQASEIEYLDTEKTKPLGKPIAGPIYFPESIIGSDNYIVTVKLTDGTILSAPLTDNILNISGKGNAIARNTYLPIVIEFVGAMDIKVEVLNWTSETYEFDFSDHVGMSSDGAVSFIENTYAEGGFDKTTGRLVLRDYPNATAGSFEIGSPVGHRWDAYLITTQGEMNAIQFVTGKDAEGNNIFTDHLSGKVGERVDFNVAATMSAGNQQREAILQVMVTLDYGGITVPVNILEGGDYGKGTENITFIQNAR